MEINQNTKMVVIIVLLLVFAYYRTTQQQSKVAGTMMSLHYITRSKNNEGKYVSNAESLPFIPYTKGEKRYSGVSVRHMTTPDFKLDTTQKITFEGKRITNTNEQLSKVSTPQYIEAFIIQTSNGELQANTTYNDPGLGFETEIPYVDYKVTSATGIYVGATYVRIIFDNKGTKFGTKFSRTVNVYA